MKIFTPILICLISCSAIAQKIPDLGLNKIRITYPDKTVQAEIVPVSSDPAIRSDRYYYWYSANQIKNTQGGFSGRLLNGSYSEFYLTKGLKEQGAFRNGLKTGVWNNWDEKGELQQTFTWSKGVKEGPFKLYNKKTGSNEAGRCRKGLLHGAYKMHHGKDSVEVKRYRRGQLVPAKSASGLWQKFIWRKGIKQDSAVRKAKPEKIRKAKAKKLQSNKP